MSFSGKLDRHDVCTMSRVIAEESNVLRIGCLSGPNLSKEILEGQPTATVIASEYDEVVSIGIELLSSKRMFVFGSSDILGAELAGAFKNIIAVGSGYLRGRLGKMYRIVYRPWAPRNRLFRVMAPDKSAFWAPPGWGPATATSSSSRNFNFGFQLGQGKQLKDVIASSRWLKGSDLK
jgi:glycerol-3-phosphate dehydrogenase (NAD(P)+)